MQFLADYYVHNLDPFIFRIYDSIGPRWYGFAYLMGFLVAYLLLKKLARDGMLRIDPQRVPDLVLNTCIFGVLIGGRLGFVLFYDLPDSLKNGRTPLLWDFSSHIPFWGVLRVYDGGMSAHGGIVFTILTLIWFTWQYNRSRNAASGFAVEPADGKSKNSPSTPPPPAEPELARRAAFPKASLINIGDAACMVVPIGLCFGRIANFINGELYGHPTTVPWAVKFPQEIYAPTNGQIDSTVLNKLPGLFQKLHFPTDPQAPTAIDQGIHMLMTRLARHDPETLRAVADILPSRHPSQLYESLLEGLLLFTICWIIGRRWRKDGMASGAFLTFYPVMRIIGEQFRVGDASFQIAGWNIGEGILLSIPMVLVGATYWAYWIWRDRRVPWTPAAAREMAKPPPQHNAGNGAPGLPGNSGR